jgi:hypothetical protein
MKPYTIFNMVIAVLSVIMILGGRLYPLPPLCSFFGSN